MADGYLAKHVVGDGVERSRQVPQQLGPVDLEC